LDTNLDTTYFMALVDTITGRIAKCKPANLIDTGPYLPPSAEHSTFAIVVQDYSFQIAQLFTIYFINKHFIVFTKLPDCNL
jgi:hypothetical protein